MRRFTALALAALFLAGCQDAVAPTDPGSSGAETRLSSAQQPADGPFADRYIVVLDRGVRDVPGLARTLTERAGGDLRFVYEHALSGFAAQLPEAALEGIRRNPAVAYVEQDGPMHAIGSGSQDNPGSWGLDRIDQRDLPLDQTYTYDASGTGVTAYILDTGILFSHDEFGGRAARGYDAIGDGQDGEDCNGHGTHVAGTVGGSEYGVAKSVDLVAVRVLDCDGSGSYSGVIAGIDWVTANAQKPAVANMSLGGGSSSSVDDAVNNSVNSGVFYAVAAGNGHWLFGTPQDACDSSPAGAAEAYTVGATEKDDDEASFSNYGTCVNMLAPGVGITSAWIGSNDDTNTISGTSMATPHVAGAAAAYLEGNTGANPDQVKQALTANASADRIALHSSSTSGGTPNLLLYTGFIGGGDGGGTTDDPPTSDFTFSCTDLTCDFTDESTDDGTIKSYAWDFGDGSTSTAQNPSHTYGAGSTYTVTLTVTDDGDQTDSSSQDVTVTEPASDGISLSASGYKERGRHHVDLTWSGATSTDVDVLLDGGLLETTANDGAYTHATNNRGQGSYTFQVCEEGTSTCSNEVTVTF